AGGGAGVGRAAGAAGGKATAGLDLPFMPVYHAPSLLTWGGPVMGWFEITCGTTLPLAPYDQPDHFVVTYTGKVVHVEDGEQETEAGHFTLYRLLRGLALDYRQNLFEVCDAHSRLLHDAYAALCNPETGDLKRRAPPDGACPE